MKRYEVQGTMTISVFVRVFANSEEEAREKAEEASVMQLCHQCADGSADEWSTSGELDGTPEITRVVEWSKSK